MMNLKICMSVVIVIMYGFELLKMYLVWQQRKKPLPEIVCHIYDTKKYEDFIQYKKAYCPIVIFTQTISTILLLIFIQTEFFSFFDNPNPYISMFSLVFVLTCIETIVKIPIQYYATFHIDAKYGLNHKNKKEFFKDELLEVCNCFIECLIYCFIIYVGTHLEVWTHHFSMTYMQSFLLCLGLLGVFFCLFLLVSFLSLGLMRLQYTFTELEDGTLRQKIERYVQESKKKIHHIKVYDESKKSNSKNAFLLKILGYREFGIADNFLEENKEDELLAVLLHEIGHLKHKKNIYNFISYIFFGLCFCGIVWLLTNAHYVLACNQWIKDSFHLVYTNYYVFLFVISTLISPIVLLVQIYHNFVSCKEEKEADYNAIDHGYGQGLIDTFSKISSDELIDVNPHPFVSFIEDDHPSMCQRITYIRKRMDEISS